MAAVISLHAGLGIDELTTQMQAAQIDSGDEDEYESTTTMSAKEATKIRRNFRRSEGMFRDDGHVSTHHQKLLLWQAILIGFAVCAPSSGPVFALRPDRPKHLEPYLLPLPSSTTKCRGLIKQYIHVSIRDFRKQDAQAKMCASQADLRKYIRKTKSYYRLEKAKEEMLQPLLRDMKMYRA